MRAISVCCRRSLERSSEAGFTLLELLVVLALAGMMVGLVAPSLMRSLDAARERGVVAEVGARLETLPVHAFQQGQEVGFAAQDLRLAVPEIPEMAELEFTPPKLVYRANGVAAGGRVRLVMPGRTPVFWRVEALTGRVFPESQ
jgi:prepilin-type N-terminal cleavage/methylation domain-containing protein